MKGNTIAVVLVILFLGVLAYNQGYLPIPSASSVGTTATPVAQTTTGTRAFLSDKTTTTFYTRDVFAKGTSLPASGTRVFVNNGVLTDKGTVANAGTLTLAPADKVTVYGGENSTGYYTLKNEFEMPDTGEKSLTSELCAIDTSPIFTSKDQAGTVGAVQAMEASTTYTMPFEIRASAEKCLGNPQINKDNIICANYNTTMFTSIELAGRNNAEGTPTNISDTQAEVGRTIKCFTYPKLKNSEVWSGAFVVKTGTTAPVRDRGHINLTNDDYDYDLNAKSLAEIQGFQDEDQNNLGANSFYLGNVLVS